ncbi:MAG: exonuclease SbcCD subunit D [Planctomycetia bacterium]
MITFIHTADWQLGKPFSRVADEKRANLKKERIDAIRRIGEVVRSNSAAFVVVAGDVFDSNSPSPETVSAACDAISSVGVPVYVIPGNHDHAGPGSVWEQPFFVDESRARAPNLCVLLDAKPVERDGYVLFPCPLGRRQSLTDPCRWIHEFDFGSADERPRIVVAHGSTLNFTQEGDEEDVSRQANFIELANLPTAQLDYVALGDWHGLVQAGDKAWYSGSHETDRFPKTGQTTGHVIVVRAGRGKPPDVTPVATGRTRWLTYAMTFATDAGPQALLDALEQITSGMQRDQVLLRLSLSGSLGLAGHDELGRIMKSWKSGLMDLRLDQDVAIAPSPAEIEALAATPEDSLIRHVATVLREEMNRGGDAAELAGTAIALLHEFAHAGESR